MKLKDLKAGMLAKKHLEWLRAKRSIEIEIAKLNDGWEPNWNNFEEDKFQVLYDVEDKTLEVLSYRVWKHTLNPMYLKTRELAKQLIKTHEKELKIYFEAEE